MLQAFKARSSRVLGIVLFKNRILRAENTLLLSERDRLVEELVAAKQEVKTLQDTFKRQAGAN